MERQSLNRVLIAAGVALALAGGGLYWWKSRTPAEAPLEAPPAEVMAPPGDADPAIEHPLPEPPPDATEAPLPALADSDGPVTQELGMLFGVESVAEYLEPQNVARRIVATVDGMTRAHGSDRLRPVKPVSPGFAVDRRPPTSPTAEERIFVSDSNASRYVPLVTLLEATDTKLVADLYQRWYPLLQQSYEDLGFPGRYFNDRVVTVIDHLLQAPAVKGPIELTQPNVLFEFADPQLEALSSGQKVLVRMGPENAAKVKAKLKELRTIVATTPRPATPAPATAAPKPPG